MDLLQAQPQPRSSSLSLASGDRGSPLHPPRRDSEAVLSEGPMTPPMSPGHSEEGCMEDSITVDSEPRFSGPTQPPVASNLGQAQQEWRPSLDEEMDGLRVLTPPKPPLRLLEDEQVHVEKSGLLRLKDFEIKGTLGQSIFWSKKSNISLNHLMTRYRDIWPSFASKAENSITRYAELFCHESPA